MTKKLGGKKERFARYLARGHNQTDSARLAGYSDYKSEGHRLLKESDVQKRVTQLTMARLINESLPAATKAINELITSPDTNDAIKLKASQYVVDKALDLQNMASLADINDKNPLDMTQAELEIFIARGRIVLTNEQAKRQAAIDMGIIEAEPAQ